MSYKLNYTDTFRETIGEMDRSEVIRILKKLEWVAQNAEQVEHERLKKPPSSLEKICKMVHLVTCGNRHNLLELTM